MSKKLTFEEVKQRTKDNVGYKLLSKKYVNVKTKYKFQCPEGHRFESTWNNFQRGQRCPTCGGTQKLNIDQVRDQTEKDGTKLLSTEYINVKTKYKFQCPEGHVYWMKYNNFQQGQRCPVCSGNKKLTIDKIRDITKDISKYEILSNKYINTHTKLKFKCSENHEFEMSWASFQNGQRCSVCSGNKKLTIEEVKQITEENTDYKLLGKKYINAQSKLKFKCSENHEFKMKWANFQQGQRCPICAAKASSSKVEIEIQKLVKQTHPTMIENDRTQILNPLTGRYLELDVWIPSLKKAIEYNGIFWHSSNYVKIKDQFKIDECKRLGINLLVIQEQDYLNNKEKELQKIRDFINTPI